MLALVLALCTITSMAVPIPAFAAENDDSCSDYTDCTANGSEIYIVTKDGCPVREEPHNKGNPSIQTNQIKGVEHSRGVPPSWVNWMLTEGRELGTTRVVKEEVIDGVKRVTYANGTLWVSVENGDLSF